MDSPVQFPVYVLAKDCGEIYRYDSGKELVRELEAIDVENDEYNAWDATGRILRLEADDVGTFSAGRIRVTSTDAMESSGHFADIVSRAVARN